MERLGEARGVTVSYRLYFICGGRMYFCVDEECQKGREVGACAPPRGSVVNCGCCNRI